MGLKQTYLLMQSLFMYIVLNYRREYRISHLPGFNFSWKNKSNLTQERLLSKVFDKIEN